VARVDTADFPRCITGDRSLSDKFSGLYAYPGTTPPAPPPPPPDAAVIESMQAEIKKLRQAVEKLTQLLKEKL
jgi:hypothetical protein